MVFIESTAFTRQLQARAGDSQMEVLRAIQQDLLRNPAAGDMVRGLGGIRKARIANPRRGKGKRGGFRYFYFYLQQRSRIYLLYLLDKGERDDLNSEERDVLRRLVEDATR